MLLVTSEHLAGRTQLWVLVTMHYSKQRTSRCTAHFVVITLGTYVITSKCEISIEREAVQVGTTSIVEANVVETRKESGKRQIHRERKKQKLAV
jgi:hypothetical protein